MSTEAKEVVRRFFEAVSRHDIEAAAALVTEDTINHGSTNQGREGVRAELEFWYAAFPDASITIEDLVAEGDRVAVRLATTATNEGEFMGTPPTGKTVSIQEIDFARVEEGRIAEFWPLVDMYGMLGQLGLIDFGMEEAV